MPRDLAGCHRQARHAASTPAHAGPTPPVRSTTTTSSLYPRARGADSTWASVAIMHAPLPPRTRGRLHERIHRDADKASTPAHAGPTRCRGGCRAGTCLYPRARGADVEKAMESAARAPLPPRTRGRLCGGRLRPAGRASTPAHAGPTPARRVWLPAPRPLPPRTRGRPRRPSSTSGRTPSTPAHAGPTRPWPGLARRAGLYPRARGADRAHRTRLGGLEPLPPRTRGRRSNCWGRPGSTASTPAHAGPTWDSRLPEETAALYPRARGADAHFRFLSVGVVPLPPRTRGRPTRPISSRIPSVLYPRARGADAGWCSR